MKRILPRGLRRVARGGAAVLLLAGLGSGCASRVEPATVPAPPAGPAAPVEPPPSPRSPANESPPAPQPTPPPRPQLLPGADAPERDAIREELERAAAILGRTDGRALTDAERRQVAAVRAFLVQAEEALDDGDVRRAAVLAEKARVLAEDVERGSRD